jgi:plastocyanin
MSVTLSTISTTVDQFNDIPDITFTGIDITEFVEEVEIYTNTPAVMIPTKLNAMASNMKSWLNSNISAPLENQQNTFKNEVVLKTNTAMNAVETYMNDEVVGFINTVFVPWANTAGVELSTASNLLENNVTTQMGQLQTDYTIHVQNQDAIIAQALTDMLTNLAQYTSGAADSGYSVHQTNLLVADIKLTREIAFDQYKYTKVGQISYAEEGINKTHHIAYNDAGGISSFGESMHISGEVKPFKQHLKLENDATGSTSVEKIKAYEVVKHITTAGVENFRVTGHEINGDPAADLTILNNTSIADVDNPELIIRRSTSNALMFDDVAVGDMIKVSNLDGSIYNKGLIGNFAEDYETILFTPHTSYCHDGLSSVSGWGVETSYGASGLDSDGGAFDTPAKCEQGYAFTGSILDDMTRSYETAVANESYDSALSDGLTYNVSISDASGVVDTYGYTIDANKTLGTGAIINPVYDNGVSDSYIVNAGTGYSINTIVRAFDLGAVDVDGSAEIKATGIYTIKNGMADSVEIVTPGAGYVGYWNVVINDNGNGHTHNLRFTQAEVNTIKSGTAVTSTTVDAGHSHDIVISWNAFNSKFVLDSMSADGHVHNDTDSYQINPSIIVDIATATGTGVSAYALLKEDDSFDSIVITSVGQDYSVGDVITITGGSESSPATTLLTLADGGINSISLSQPGSGYTDTTAKTVSVAIQNSMFVPSDISANVGDTVEFTNLDIQAHTVTHVDGVFDSGDIPQNAVFSYTITKDTELTEKYNIVDSNGGQEAVLWVRENTVFVDMVTTTGGGMRGVATVNAAGNVINIAVDRPGKNYTPTDSLRILDVSGAGEGAYGVPILDRSVGALTIVSGGANYSESTQVKVFDPTGFPVYDTDGTTEISRTYGTGAIIGAEVATDDIAGSCVDTNYTDEATCVAASSTWTAAVVKGEINKITIAEGGTGYADISIIINDPQGTGTGADIVPDINNVVSKISMTSRGQGYTQPTLVVTDSGGTVGTDSTNTVGLGYEGLVGLNNGIGGASILEDWADYINGTTRVIFLDVHPQPTGYGATATVSLGGAGNISNIIIDNPGSSYKQPVIVVAGPVTQTGAGINSANTAYALYGPKGNDDLSPFSAGGSAGTNFKNGVMVEWQQYEGHTQGDSWEFTTQSWVKGSPDSLVYESSRYDGVTNNMRGVLSLKDIWDV